MYCPDCGLQNRDTAKFCTGCGVTLKEVTIGAVLGGRYRVDARLGQGGMGVVYRAWDVRLECACALKEMNAAGQTPDERAESVARFKREAQTLRGLSHPGLPKVYDFFDDGGRHFLVQDFIEGENFEVILARDGKPGLPEAEVRALALEVLDILAYLHAQSPPVLHRDVKPSNIMRKTGTGQIVLLDFGIARSQVAHTGTAIGTPEYCAPEQYTGKAVPASDLYALGATLHHLLTGAVPTPFQFTSAAGVSPDLQAVLAKATALNARDRYASVDEMRQALAGAWTAGFPQLMAPPPRIPPVPLPPLGVPPSAVATSPAPTMASMPPTMGSLGAVPTVVASASGGGRSSGGLSAVAMPISERRKRTARAVVIGGALLCLLLTPFFLKGTTTSSKTASATTKTTTLSGEVDATNTTAPSGDITAATFVNPKDGTVLIRIPGGTYTMGSDTGEDDEKPVHSVTLQPYAIGQCEVTNAQFRKFVSASGHATAGDWEGSARRWGDDAPVVKVSWHDANAYCTWAGLRLPTEAEWEVAARGPDGSTYPWGNTWDASKCRSSVGGREASADRPVAVGSYPQGASPFGCLDMAGNVWEWCSSKYVPYPYVASDGREGLHGDVDRVLRGGSWCDNGAKRFRGAYRYRNDLPSDWYGCRGFRCAKTL